MIVKSQIVRNKRAIVIGQFLTPSDFMIIIYNSYCRLCITSRLEP